MTDTTGYDVYLFPNAIEALGDAGKPYLKDGPGGSHFSCKDVDTSGILTEMTLDAGDGKEVEVMIPTNMVRMIVSNSGTAGEFGFGRRGATVEPGIPPAKS
ncbi:MAG: hypothetical protein JSR50_06455 [Proteobacteria bacterium]|nr:hypothetical protein [Pseudomonadota bacterium]